MPNPCSHLVLSCGVHWRPYASYALVEGLDVVAGDTLVQYLAAAVLQQLDLVLDVVYILVPHANDLLPAVGVLRPHQRVARLVHHFELYVRLFGSQHVQPARPQERPHPGRGPAPVAVLQHHLLAGLHKRTYTVPRNGIPSNSLDHHLYLCVCVVVVVLVVIIVVVAIILQLVVQEVILGSSLKDTRTRRRDIKSKDLIWWDGKIEAGGHQAMTVKATSHLLFYAFAFGGTSFYSYVASPVAFKVLERDQFSTLQNHMFPMFFKLQSVSPVVLGLTAPFALSSWALSSLAVASLGGLTNLLWLMPWTRRIKEQRWEVKEKYKDDAEKLEELDAPLRKEFGKSHGLSLLFNVTHITGLLAYGIILSRNIARYIPK